MKGYGDVRRRLLGVLDMALDTVLRVAERDTGVATGLAGRLRTLVLEGPDGETRAEVIVAAVRDRLAAGDLGGARSALLAP